MYLFPPKCIFKAAKAWIEASALASVPANVLYKSTSEIGISVLKKNVVLLVESKLVFENLGIFHV